MGVAFADQPVIHRPTVAVLCRGEVVGLKAALKEIPVLLLDVQIHAQIGVLRAQCGLVQRRIRRRHIRRIVHAVVGRRRAQRRVRAQKAGVDDPARPGAEANIVDDPIGKERRFAELGRIRRRRAHKARLVPGRNRIQHIHNRCRNRHPVPRQMPDPGVNLIAGLQPRAVHKPRHRRLIRCQRRIPWRPMARIRRRVAVAKQYRLRPRRPRHDRQSLKAIVQRHRVAQNPMGHQIPPAQQRRPGRRARRTACIMVAKHPRLRRQRIDVRRVHNRMTRHPDAIGAPLIQSDKQNLFHCPSRFIASPGLTACLPAHRP